MKELVAEASNRFPAVKLIAWDLAHGEKGWQIVEGNSEGQMMGWQSSSETGLRKILEKNMGWQNSKRRNK